jgi:hypothetical protein
MAGKTVWEDNGPTAAALCLGSPRVYSQLESEPFPIIPTGKSNLGSWRQIGCYSFKISSKSGTVVGMDRLMTDTVNQIGTENPQQGHNSKQKQGTEKARQPTKQKPGKARGPTMKWAGREPRYLVSN